MKRALLVALGCGLVLGAAACGGDDDELVLSDDAVVEYTYGDSSVPPEYHRSYTLTIQKDEVHVVVDSYGDVLQDTTVDLPSDAWAALEDASAVQDLDAEETEDSCSGGTTRSISIHDGDTEVATEFGVCNNNEAPAEQLDAYVQPVIDAIPNWNELLA